MKLRVVSRIAVLLMLLAMPVWPHAGPEHGKQDKEVRHHDLRGTITSIDPQAKTFHVQMRDKVVICFFDEKTRVTRDGRDISFSELKSGDTITCRCSAEKQGRHYSQRVWLRSR